MQHANRFGSRVRRFREVRGYSQGRLAALAGLHANTVKRVEAGTISPKIRTLDAIAKALKVKAADLLATGGGR